MSFADDIDGDTFKMAHDRVSSNYQHDNGESFSERLSITLCRELSRMNFGKSFDDLETRITEVLRAIEFEKGCEFLVTQHRAVYTILLFKMAAIESEFDTATKMQQITERADLPPSMRDIDLRRPTLKTTVVPPPPSSPPRAPSSPPDVAGFRRTSRQFGAVIPPASDPQDPKRNS